MKCKVDTGARTSALHAFFLERFAETGRARVRFGLHPRQRDTETVSRCEVDIADERAVIDPGGHQERRIEPRTDVIIGPGRWPVEITLTDRDNMRFRLLLGRTAIRGPYRVDPGPWYLPGKPDTNLES